MRKNINQNHIAKYIKNIKKTKKTQKKSTHTILKVYINK